MKAHYFDQEKADDDDVLLALCKNQGYVPKTCLLGGGIVWGLVNGGKSPCSGCNCDREKCSGSPKMAPEK